MIRHGAPPPPGLPALPLPSTRGAAGLRQRPVPSRGGQLQVGGIVVGSWGANYGQPRPAPLGGGSGTYRGGRGRPPHMEMNTNFQPSGYQQEQQQQVYGRGRTPRKSGPPTSNVNKKNNVSIIFFNL